MNPRKVTLALIIASLMVGCGKKQPETTKVGAILPLTGDLAVYGQKMKNGIDLALEMMRETKTHEQSVINVVYEDDAGDPVKSVSAFQKLVSSGDIRIVLGGATSSCALAITPMLDRYKVVLFSPAATSPKLTGASKYFFRNWQSDDYEGKEMGEFVLKHMPGSKVALLYVNNDWGVGLTSVFKKVTSDSLLIVAAESFPPGSTDFRAALAKIKASRATEIYVVAYAKELIPILRQKEEIALRAGILSSSGFYDPQVILQSGRASENAIFTVPLYDTESKDSIVHHFVESYEKRFGVKPDIWAAQAFDAMNIISTVLGGGAQTTEQIVSGMTMLKGYKGVTGETKFDSNGDVVKPLRFMKVVHGKFEQL